VCARLERYDLFHFFHKGRPLLQDQGQFLIKTAMSQSSSLNLSSGISQTESYLESKLTATSSSIATTRAAIASLETALAAFQATLKSQLKEQAHISNSIVELDETIGALPLVYTVPS